MPNSRRGAAASFNSTLARRATARRPCSLDRRRANAYSFDHEKLYVYRVAREFVVVAPRVMKGRLPRGLNDQFDRASTSILFNIGEGAGKMSRADKQRFYEIARGSTLESATQIEVMLIRDLITEAQYRQARSLLLRLSMMLSRLCAGPPDS